MIESIEPNREEFEGSAPLFTQDANAFQEDLPESLEEQTQPEKPAENPMKEEVPGTALQETAKKRHRSTKAEMEAKRRAAEEAARKADEEEARGPVPESDSPASNIPLMEAVFRIGMELSCPKTNGQVNAATGERWNYRNVEDILCALKPLMRKYGVFVTFSTRIECVGELNYVMVEATARNLSGETFTTTSSAREDFSRPGKWAAQITGSCESYAKKYALQSMFMIDNTRLDAVEDPDATSNRAPIQPETCREMAAGKVAGEKEALRATIKPLLVRGCGDWMTRAADAANWTGTREEYAAKVRRNYRISDDDLLILLSALPAKK